MTRAFSNPLVRGGTDVVIKARTIKRWTRELLALADSAVVSVNELVCHLPGCPPRETVVLVIREGRTTQVSIHKAMRDVTENDIANGFSAVIRGSGQLEIKDRNENGA